MKQELSGLCVLSLSVRSGDAAQVRELVTFKEDEVLAQLNRILSLASQEGDTPSLFYLNTCHRVEMYTFGLDPALVQDLWLRARGVDWDSGRLLQGVDAFRHLVRVTSSLESEVLGETQITGQVKEAADRARQNLLLKGPLDRSVQHALRAAKKIRHSTSLSQGTVSVAHVAVDGLTDVFDSFDQKSALLIGAGSVAVQALERLSARGVQKLTWINRSRDRIEKHSLKDRVQIEDYSRRFELAWQHSIVVVATASPELVLSLEDIKGAEQNARRAVPKTDPRIILDLGLPRNVEEKIHGYRGFFLRNVDEFKDRAEENSELRRAQVQLAESIVELEAESFVKLWNTWEKGPLIAEIFKGIEKLREQEVRSLTSEVSLEKNDDIEYIVRSIYAKLMHRLVEEMDGLEEPLATQIMETMVRAWRHPEQWLQRSQQASERRPKQKQK